MRTIPSIINKELIENLYINEKKSIREIGNLYRKSPKQVSRYLKMFNIKARPFSTRGLSSWNKGMPMKSSSKKKLSLSHIGKKIPIEIRKKMGSKKEKNPSWKGGITPANRLARATVEYKLWRDAVYRRDKYICQKCLKRCGKDINAHHIKHFASHPEFRTSIENGITLCGNCHKKEHKSRAN